MTEALTPSFTVHCPTIATEELPSLCRVSLTICRSNVRIDVAYEQVDSGQRFCNLMFSSACRTKAVCDLPGQHHSHSGTIHS